MSLAPTLAFLEQLAENNTKPWFDEHRGQYEEARAAFEQFIAEVIARFQAVDDIGHLDPKDAIHRISRDVRFSKDKSPYNTFMSALIGPEGRKSVGRAYYIRIAPRGRSLIASGAMELSGPELQTIRQQISDDARPLRAIIEAEEFRRFFGTLRGEQVKGAPSGYPRDHPAIDLLRYKEFLAECSLADEAVAQEGFVNQVIETCLVARPLTLYFDQLLGPRSRPAR